MKKCKVCEKPFTPVRPLQSVCSPKCALKKVRAEQKAERETDRKRRQALETKPELVKKAQAAFNTYIRLRDKGKQCISCDTMLGDQPNTYDAGHMRSVGSAPHLRFDENNVHGQCKHCNQYLAGNVINYRLRLIQRIGIEEVERIESDNQPKHYTKDELREIAKLYRDKIKALK